MGGRLRSKGRPVLKPEERGLLKAAFPGKYMASESEEVDE